MWILFSLWLQIPRVEIEHRAVTEVLKVIPVTGEDGHVVSLTACRRVGDDLFLLDRDSLKIAKIGLKDNRVSFFAGAGQAPGELNPQVLSLVEREGLLNVFHASGKRMDLFDLKGLAVSSERFAEPGSVIYLDQRGTLTKDQSNHFRLRTKNGEAEIDTFPMKTFGFYLRTALFLDRYFLIANKSANKDLFVFAVFDMNKGSIQGSFEVEMTNKKYEDGVPAWVLKSIQKKGIDAASAAAGIFLVMLNPVVTHDDYGFLMCEQGGEDEPTFAIHIYDPRTQRRRLMRIRKGPLKIPRFFLPLEDEKWATFDSRDGEIVIFKME